MTGFSKIAYTSSVRRQQHDHGSRNAIARTETDDVFAGLTAQEQAFIGARDEFYLGTINADGWPYIQYKSGPKGFVECSAGPSGAVDTLRYVEVAGNRQYVSFGNLEDNPKLSLFFIDYVRRMRLKIFGLGSLEQHPAGANGRISTVIRIRVEASTWNCPKSIIPRFSVDELVELGVRAPAAPGR